MAPPHPLRFTKLPFYQDYSFNSYSFTQVFPSETKREKIPKFPPPAQCQSPFNANSAQEISAFQRHPYNYPRCVSNAITAYTDGSKRHAWPHTYPCCSVLSQNVGKQRGTKFTDPFATSCESYPCCSVLYQGIKKRALINNINCRQQTSCISFDQHDCKQKEPYPLSEVQLHLL